MWKRNRLTFDIYVNEQKANITWCLKLKKHIRHNFYFIFTIFLLSSTLLIFPFFLHSCTILATHIYTFKHLHADTLFYFLFLLCFIWVVDVSLFFLIAQDGWWQILYILYILYYIIFFITFHFILKMYIYWGW